MNWVNVCELDKIEQEGAFRFDHSNRTYAVYRGPDDSVYCTAGLCTHEAIHLADGLVIDFEVECPKHSGAFDYRTGEALRLPACENLQTYPVQIVDGMIQISIK
ncbi:MocE family 2Fe-2S type ferredoxin [Rhizobium sp. NPDC090275]|uniref:MocE family 2Fe-2S type ferredoxin n=1 Tax=Rhizobium sp. NPDC090275 TaxID=3364498 RepID=UPI00383A9B35